MAVRKKDSHACFHFAPNVVFYLSELNNADRAGRGGLNSLMKQRHAIRFVFLLLVFLLLTGCGASAENLLINGDFQELDEEGLPAGWYTDAYVPEPGYTEFKTGEEPGERSSFAEIHNYRSNDARFAQAVAVEPESFYCLSGYIRADNVTGGHGANLSVEGVYAFSEECYDTDGQWQYIEYYGETGPEQDQIIVFARLGGYSGESTGVAAFSDLKLVRVDSIPEDGIRDLWFAESDAGGDEENYDGEEDYADEEEAPAPVWPWLLGIALAGFLSVTAAVLYNRHRPHRRLIRLIRRAEPRNPKDWNPDRRLYWSLKDTLILAGITLVYSLISLLTLGSTKAPQSGWTSSGENEQIVFDLGSRQEDFEILYFARVSYDDFSVSVSEDGLNWEEEIWAQMKEGQCWTWKYVTASYETEDGERKFTNPYEWNIVRFSGRYVRLSSQQYALKLNEILFRNPDGKVLSPVIVSRDGADPESQYYSDPSALIDEPDTLEALPALFADETARSRKAEPSWWNSTYFDEIYHARTAYEFLQRDVPYENTHPPLGKELMSVSIAAFGMTPFGWRFAGAVVGILMLPGMYLLGKQLTKKTWPATMACLLMALDCMHLTQSQIATIDSFPVLFIIFSFFFMLRFLQTDFVKEKTSVSLVSLGFSGLFMGLSIASKWIGIYAGAGLAVLFFWHCIRVICLEKEAASMSKKRKKTLRADSSAALHRTLVLCLWCVLFFAAVPLLVYLLCYIPYFAYKAGQIHSLSDYLGEVWRVQIHMFNYHSTPGRGMEHSFYSPWWEWPFILRPMYYANELYLPDTTPVHYSIFCFGNPVIWYGGVAALAYCVFRSVLGRRYQSSTDPDLSWHLRSTSYDPRNAFIFIGLLAQYLPWVLVPRGTYIYHYFASLPFLMLAICLCFDGYPPKSAGIMKVCSVLLILSALIFFGILFPYASGIGAPSAWLDLGPRLLRIWY